MHHFKLTFAALAVSVVAFAADTPVGGPSDAFQVRYASNLTMGDSVINLTNTGTLNGYDPAGNICVNVYAFAQDEQLISCCSCLVTPNGLNSLSVKSDLISNTLTPGIPTGVVIKLVASTASGSCYNSARSVTGGNLAPGMRAWGTTIHAMPAGGFGVTETEFSPAVLSASELNKITTYCGFIIDNGSGYGICNSCKNTGLGGKKK